MLQTEETQNQHSAEQVNISKETAPLTALDRCDSCGAQAYVRATLNGNDLLFCAHHARAHEPKLKPIAEVWHDETHKLS